MHVIFKKGDMVMKKLLIIVLVFALFACSRQKPDKLVIGLIKPSLNHLPLQYALKNIPGDYSAFQFEYFHSGWETNEALVAGKIDLAIMPFTYIWIDAAQGRNVKIISFFERESDGIIADRNYESLSDLQSGKLGVLKNSTLEIIPELVFEHHGLMLPQMIYFRTPMDMAAALNSRQVDALCFYVPPIFNFSADYEIINWLGETFPSHTCCNIAANGNILTPKSELITKFMALMHQAAELFLSTNDSILDFAAAYYDLDKEFIAGSLLHTRYKTGLDDEGIAFETKAAELMLKKNYMTKMVDKNEIYYPISP